MTVTAKYNGTFGNKINIAVSKDKTNGLMNIITYVNGNSLDSQKVSNINELDDNDYVTFSGSGEIDETSGTPLSGGTNGTVTDSVAYPNMFKKLKLSKWQTYACFSSETSIKSSVVEFIEQMREDEGRYVQAVISDYNGADYEGIINSISSAIVNDIEYSKEDFVSIVAGMTAGSNFNESNTGKAIKGATSIINELTDTEIKKALSNGKFLISTSTKGVIKVEQDINSLHTFTKEKDYNFSKNRVIRTLDEIGTSIVMTWEDTYMGKVDNTDTGRGLFQSDLIVYGNELQRLGGIQEFKGSDDISISQGNNLDSVVVNWFVKPVDSMEKLYMTVKVNS